MSTIYVHLLGEGTQVWRPVNASFLGGMDYQIDPMAIVPGDEQWQFEPGERVKCEFRTLCDTAVLVAIARALEPPI